MSTPRPTSKKAVAAVVKSQIDDAIVSTIRALAADGHALEAIAAHLNRNDFRAPRGGRWVRMQVSRVATKHGIKVVYDPAKIAAAKAREAKPEAASAPVPGIVKVDTLANAPSEAGDVRADRARRRAKQLAPGIQSGSKVLLMAGRKAGTTEEKKR